jgi:hypothetical protein
MKKYMIMALLGTLVLAVGCNDEWEDELYSKMVSIKAPINTDVTYLYLKYETNGEVTYDLPVLISGSTSNSQNVTVKMGVDNDTIPLLNTYIYSDREDLYYKQLGESHYEFPKNEVVIPAGEDQALFQIKFKFADLDLVEKYVLPVTVLEDSSYEMNTYKGRNKALLWVRPFNDYSGVYQSGSVTVYYGTSAQGQAMTATQRTAQVVSENTIFWYAGITEELSATRGNYKTYAEFLEPTKVTQLTDKDTGLPNGLVEIEGNLRLYADADNTALGFEVVGQPTYHIIESWDTNKSYIKHRNTEMKVAYKYKDFTSSTSGAVFDYYCTGTMNMQRDINTLAPEDMQAYYW